MTLSEFPLRPRVLILAVFNLLLFGVLGFQIFQPLRFPVSSSAVGDLLPKIDLKMPVSDAASDADVYALLIGQPLFHEDRHYIPEQAVAVAVVETPPPAYTLTGYLGLPGRRGRAFLLPVNGGSTVAVSVGDQVEGWTVLDASARRVVLRQGERAFAVSKEGSVPESLASSSGAAASPDKLSTPAARQSAASAENAAASVAPIKRPRYPMPPVMGTPLPKSAGAPIPVAPQTPPRLYAPPPTSNTGSS